MSSPSPGCSEWDYEDSPTPSILIHVLRGAASVVSIVLSCYLWVYHRQTLFHVNSRMLLHVFYAMLVIMSISTGTSELFYVVRLVVLERRCPETDQEWKCHLTKFFFMFSITGCIVSTWTVAAERLVASVRPKYDNAGRQLGWGLTILTVVVALVLAVFYAFGSHSAGCVPHSPELASDTLPIIASFIAVHCVVLVFVLILMQYNRHLRKKSLPLAYTFQVRVSILMLTIFAKMIFLQIFIFCTFLISEYGRSHLQDRHQIILIGFVNLLPCFPIGSSIIMIYILKQWRSTQLKVGTTTANPETETNMYFRELHRQWQKKKDCPPPAPLRSPSDYELCTIPPLVSRPSLAYSELSDE